MWNNFLHVVSGRFADEMNVNMWCIPRIIPLLEYLKIRFSRGISEFSILILMNQYFYAGFDADEQTVGNVYIGLGTFLHIFVKQLVHYCLLTHT